MNKKLVMSMQIASIAALTAILAASAVMAVTANHNALAASDVCVTERTQDGSSVSTACFVGPDAHELAKELKQDCRENTDLKCSSSQTGNGEFGNFFKPNQQ
jgi:hypothetical protein